MNDVLTYEEFQRTKYWSALDGIRALAILFVISAHLKNVGWVHRIWPQAGPTLFFMVSGYLMTLLALREEVRRGTVNLRAFHIRRTARLFPAYYAALFLHVIIIFGFGFSFCVAKRGPFLAALPYYASMYFSDYGVGPAGSNTPFYQSWYLGVEQKFALVWPVVAFMLLRGKPRGRIAFILACLAAFHPFQDTRIADFLYLRHYMTILVGCLLAICLNEPDMYERLRRFATMKWQSFFLLILLIFHASTFHVQVLKFYYPYVLALFMLGIVCGNSVWNRALNWRPLLHLGKRSYGIYLIHLLVMNAVELVIRPATMPLWKVPIYYFATIALSLVAAEVMFRVLEKPAMTWGHNWSNRIMAAKSPATERAVA